jgi:hypothetical protein
LTPSERKYHIVSTTFLVFVDACENLIMADDVTTPLNSPVSLIKKEELKEASLDVNVFQRSHKQESSRRVMRTWVDRLAWDRRLSPNPHALAIYLKFVHACGAALERFEKCHVKMTTFIFIFVLGFLVMAIIVGCEAQSTPFPWNIEPNT